MSIKMKKTLIFIASLLMVYPIAIMESAIDHSLNGSVSADSIISLYILAAFGVLKSLFVVYGLLVAFALPPRLVNSDMVRTAIATIAIVSTFALVTLFIQFNAKDFSYLGSVVVIGFALVHLYLALIHSHSYIAIFQALRLLPAFAPESEKSRE
ncbi:hypothetical protein [Thiomicrorhabdus sediminis]|uniref:Uncharacterized protein n=1 Tax=Thiomicrorhabdus sediminis TaxID=2580412 RepID=A0A4P9K7W1_9GAMM|nr:hypothetical protein [Thiomicrorhabdus sediminis]QCU90550.1 hypothetical protein FE785_07840 [Thiomicrorhabdus sediminis]